MSECRLLEEHGRNHFMTRRFDRTPDGHKLHMQSLCALQHYDFNQPGAYSYEQALQTARALGLPMAQIEQLYRRMAFNIVARNQDDHVKNIAFLMDKTGQWSLSPAFDMTYSYNPEGRWTSSHQMSLNGKRDDFTLEDFVACEKALAMKRGRGREILGEVSDAVRQWPKFAALSGTPEATAARIADTHRTDIQS
jgi:serine/threonine-protein kinase HipA